MGRIILCFALSALGFAGASHQYALVESYDNTNFFDKFNFIEVSALLDRPNTRNDFSTKLSPEQLLHRQL